MKFPARVDAEHGDAVMSHGGTHAQTANPARSGSNGVIAGNRAKAA